MTDYEMPRCLCPWCGYSIDRATNVSGQRMPEAGDITLCLKCASPSVFDADLALKKILESDIKAWLDEASHAEYQRARRALLRMDRSNVGAGKEERVRE